MAEIKIIVSVVVLALILWLEGLVPFFAGRSGWAGRGRHIARNLGVGLFNGLLLALLFSSLTVVVIDRYSSAGLVGRVTVTPWIQTCLAILMFDLWMYLWHRANHRVPFLWRFHRMHHTDDQVDATTALRFHTGELIFSSVLRLAVVPLLGMSLAQVIFYETLLQPVIMLHHSNVAIPERIDRILRMIIVTPGMHRVHHSQLGSETNSNYSSIFSWWDRIGRSFCRRTDWGSLRFGLPDFSDSRWQTFFGMLRTPLKTGSSST